MHAIKKTGRITGVLLLLLVLTGAPAVMLRGLSTALTNAPDFLEQVFQNSLSMRFSVLLDMVAAALWLGIVGLLFPMIKQYSYRLALWILAIFVAYLAVIVFGNISHLSLLSVGQRFVDNGATDAGYLVALGQLQVSDYFWAHFMSLMLYSSGAAALYLFFLKARLIPKVLAVWGIVALVGVFTACWLNIFDFRVPFIVYNHNGLHMIVLIIWLLAKGFRPDVTTSSMNAASVHQD